MTCGDVTRIHVALTIVSPVCCAFCAQVLDKVCPAVIGLRDSGFDLADWFIPPGYVVDR